MKNNKVKRVIIIALVALLSLVGISYAFFNYSKIGGQKHELITGKLYLNLVDGTNSISLDNIFPQTAEEARSSTTNVLNFSITGINDTTNKDVYYEIKLNEGNDIEGKTRFNPEDLRFDLVEIIGETTKTVVEDMSFSDFNDRRIWVNTIENSTNEEVSIQYQLRMWLDEDVLISDTDPNAIYSASEYKNHYANVTISAYADFKEKSGPMNYLYGEVVEDDETGDVSFWPTVINEQKANITEIHFVSMKKATMDKKYAAATIKADVTDTTKSSEGSVLTWLEADANDSTKYKMYVASDGVTFFPEDCTFMFAMFSSLTDIKFNNINTRNVMSMGAMFAMCTSLTSVDLSDFDTSNVTMLVLMFYGCTGLTELDLSNFDISKVENLSALVAECTNLTTINLSGWELPNVTEYEMIFEGCTSLTNVNMSDWNIETIALSPFELVSGLENLNLNLSNWDVKMLLDLSALFKDWTNLVSLDLSNWNTKYIINMSEMFSGCTNLVSLDLTGWNTENVTNMSSMFAGCINLKELDVSSFNTRNVTDMSYMFSGCASLTKLNLSNFNTRNVTNMAGMFWGNNLEEINLSNFDTRNVTNMANMFCASAKIVSLDLSNFDTRKVTDLSNMFNTCSKLSSLNVSSFDTRNVTNMAGMFEECGTSSLNLDLSSFVTTNVTNMNRMFALASFNSLDIRNFTFGEILTDYTSIFGGSSHNATVLVKSTVEKEWILNLSDNDRSSSWTTDNVIVATD